MMISEINGLQFQNWLSQQVLTRGVSPEMGFVFRKMLGDFMSPSDTKPTTEVFPDNPRLPETEVFPDEPQSATTEIFPDEVRQPQTEVFPDSPPDFKLGGFGEKTEEDLELDEITNKPYLSEGGKVDGGGDVFDASGHAIPEVDQINLVKNGNKPIVYVSYNGKNLEAMKDINHQEFNEDGVTRLIGWKNGQEENAIKLMKLVELPVEEKMKMGNKYHEEFGKLLGYSDKRIKDFISKLSPTEGKR